MCIIYGAARVSRIDKTIGLLCRIASLLQVFFAIQTYNFIDPTNRSHPIVPPTQRSFEEREGERGGLVYTQGESERDTRASECGAVYCSALQCTAVFGSVQQ